MQNMPDISLILGAVSTVTGGIAAWFWFQSSRVKIVPHDVRGGRFVEIPTADPHVWIEALKQSLEETGRLNKWAALFTAVSIACGGLSAVFVALPA